MMHTTTDPRAWSADTAGDRAAWQVPLPDSLWADLEPVVAEFRRHPQPIPAVGLPERLRARMALALQPVVDILERGTGFVVMKGMPLERYSSQEAQLLYWLIGQVLGRPMEQNAQGTMLYDVRDTGQDVRYGARFSVTNAESTFHTDNSFGEAVLDYVGLLCLQTARSGGLSQVVSGIAVCQRLRAEHPEALAILSRPFHIDRRGGLRPGEAPTAWFPVFQWQGDELLCRYLRYWIEAGHEKNNDPLTPAQTHALDVLDAVLNDEALRLEFNLAPGDMFYINNRWIFHNRTGFEDHPELERKRHYVRLWLQAQR